MEISIDKKDSSYGVLTLQVSEADYLPEFNKQLKEYSKKASIKGFRPGKVPAGLIKKMYGKELRQDVFNHTITKSVDDYIEENKIAVLFKPVYKGDFITPEDLEAADTFSLEFEVCLEPEFEYALSKDLKVKSYKLDVTEEDVEDTISRLKESYPVTIRPETTDKGDFITADFKAVDGDFDKNTVLPLNKVAEGELENFLGKAIDDKVTFDVNKTFADKNDVKLLFGITIEEAEALSGEIEMTITEITRNGEAELNQEFFDKVLGPDTAKTEEEFRSALKDKVAEANLPAIDGLLTEEIREVLMEAIELHFPAELLKKIYKENYDREVEVSDEELEKQMPFFEKAVKWRVISNKYFKEGELKIEDQDIKDGAREVVGAQLANMGFPVMDDEQLDTFVDSYLNHEGGKNANDIFEKVFNEKLFTYIKELITLDEEVITLKQMNDMYEERSKKNDNSPEEVAQA